MFLWQTKKKNAKKDKIFGEIFLLGLPPKNLEKMTENGVRDVQKTVVFRFLTFLHPQNDLEIPHFCLTFHPFRSLFSNFQGQLDPQSGFQKG